MPNPTRQEITEAYDALEKLCKRLPATRAAEEFILKALPPKPLLTMDEVEWDDELHYLAEAEHPEYGKVIMLRPNLIGGKVRIFFEKDGVIYSPLALAKNLTPTGKRYTLTEVQE